MSPEGLVPPTQPLCDMDSCGPFLCGRPPQAPVSRKP